jgi:hypothetical protein
MVGKQSSAPIDRGSVGTSIAWLLAKPPLALNSGSASIYLGGSFYSILSVQGLTTNYVAGSADPVPDNPESLAEPTLPGSFDSLINFGAIDIECGRDHDSARDSCSVVVKIAVPPKIYTKNP